MSLKNNALEQGGCSTKFQIFLLCIVIAPTALTNYGIKKYDDKRKEHSLQTNDKKIAERKLKAWIADLDKIDTEAEKTTLAQLLGERPAHHSSSRWTGILPSTSRLEICCDNASRKASHTIGICRSRLPLPRTEMTRRSISTCPMFVATTSLTRIPVENKTSRSADSWVTRIFVIGFVLACLRGERSNDLTVDRAMVRGRLFPTFTSLRNPLNGLLTKFPQRSQLANMDLSVANLRRTVRGFASSMLPSQR